MENQQPAPEKSSDDADATGETPPKNRGRWIAAIAIGILAIALIGFAYYWLVVRRTGTNGGGGNNSSTPATILTPASGCSSINVNAVRLRGTETPKTDPTATASTAGCANACISHTGWTFNLSNSTCTCIDKPFASDGKSMERDGNYVSGFYPTDPPVEWAPCGTFTISDQRLYSDSQSPITTNYTDIACASTCRGTYPAWTRERSSGRCYCIPAGTWSQDAMQYMPGWSSGFLPT